MSGLIDAGDLAGLGAGALVVIALVTLLTMIKIVDSGGRYIINAMERAYSVSLTTVREIYASQIAEVKGEVLAQRGEIQDLKMRLAGFERENAELRETLMQLRKQTAAPDKFRAQKTGVAAKTKPLGERIKRKKEGENAS